MDNSLGIKSYLKQKYHIHGIIINDMMRTKNHLELKEYFRGLTIKNIFKNRQKGAFLKLSLVYKIF